MNSLYRLGLGLVFSSLVGILAYRRQSLSASGVVGAILTGTVIFGFGGWAWGLLLITFFVLSSLLSMYKAHTKMQLAEKFAKGSRRDLGQVLANGGAGALLALATSVTSHPVLLFAFAGAIATVNADTWATELGVLSRRSPRLITNGKRVEPGTSGGVSLLGTLATLAGGATMGLAAAVYLAFDTTLGNSRTGVVLVATSTLGGLVGSLFDSLLGATVQAIYYAHHRGKETEKPVEADGTPNKLIRGWRWLNNDWVNFLSSLVGAAVAALLYMWSH